MTMDKNVILHIALVYIHTDKIYNATYFSYIFTVSKMQCIFIVIGTL
jgi:hypothetical protein